MIRSGGHGGSVFWKRRRMPTTDRFSLAPLEFEGVLDRVGLHCRTAAGRERLRRTAPSSVPGEAQEWLAQSQEAVRLLGAGVRPSFAGIGDVRALVRHVASGGRPLEGVDLASVAASLRAMEAARAVLAVEEERAPRLAAIAASIPDLRETAAAIERCVNARGEVRDAASPKLEAARAEERAVKSSVERAMERIAADPDVRRILFAPRFVYRHDRPVIAVKAEHRHRVQGLLLDRSTSGNTVYIEPAEVVELGNRLSELSLTIAREISGVLLEASRRLLAARERLEVAFERVGELDLAFAKGEFARELDACIPELVSGRRLRLVKARHPKLALRALEPAASRAAAVTPIDIEVGGAFDLLVITGPNTGGKTVALKTLGLLAVMALSGLPVPASACEIPLLDGVFVDVGDEQEIAQSLSTFSSHMVRVAHALTHATRDSLVLFDEVGAGTDPTDGAALGEAILEHLLRRGIRTIATTHLGRLKDLAFRLPRTENATVAFDPVTLVPRYQLILGIPGQSQALAVARRVGIPSPVLERAEAELAQKDTTHDEALLSIQRARHEAEQLRARAEEAHAEAARVKEDLDRRTLDLERKREALATEAERTVSEAVARLRGCLRRSLDPILAAAPRVVASELARLRDELEAAIATEPIERRREAFVAGLKRDSIVYIPKLRARCVVKKVNRERRTVTIVVGDLAAEVPFDEVTWYETL